MIVCMVSPHLPPDQAANALLPQLLHDRMVELGHEVRLMAFEPREGAVASADVHYIRRPRNGWSRKLRFSQMETSLSVWSEAREAFQNADVVHIHSNTFMNQVAAVLAHRRGLPFLLTHYGTEIWHYRPRRLDPFLWMNRHAAHVTYYSKLLMSRSLELGVVPPSPIVVYPPVDRRFRFPTAEERRAARSELGLDDEPMLLNVKRLHPLAGQRFLVEAMPFVLESHPRAKLFIVGEGESRAELEELVREHELESAVRFPGLVDNRDLPRYYQASDLFVLPSRLEAFPTVAAEALASGLRVVSADHPGGLELSHLFPEDVMLVPRERVEPLAEAIVEALRVGGRSAEPTRERIEREFRPESAVQSFLDLYRSAVEGEAVARD